MSQMKIEIRLPLPDPERTFCLASARSADAAAEVIRCLLSLGEDGPRKILLEVHYDELD